MVNTKYHEELKIPFEKEYVQGKRDLFAAVISLKILLPTIEFKQFIADIDTTINTLESQLKVLKISDVLNEMGFPTNWKEIKSLNK